MTEIGEYLVGAYLKEIKKCGIVDYNERQQGGGRRGQNELDVIGFDFTNSEVYLCEVSTHIVDLSYGKGTEYTIQKIKDKFEVQQEYYNTNLKDKFNQAHFMLWAPKASKNILKGLGDCKNLKLVVNDKYTECVNELIKKSKKYTNPTGNPAFRLLQIISHMK
jgi:hypothetical protein